MLDIGFSYEEICNIKYQFSCDIILLTNVFLTDCSWLKNPLCQNNLTYIVNDHENMDQNSQILNT